MRRQDCLLLLSFDSMPLDSNTTWKSCLSRLVSSPSGTVPDRPRPLLAVENQPMVLNLRLETDNNIITIKKKKKSADRSRA